MSKNKTIGKIGEDLAKAYLISKGFKFVIANYNTPVGEIDLVFIKNNTLYLVEVKTKTNDKFGTGIDAITRRKIEKIKKTAEIYITDNGWSESIQLLWVSILYRSYKDFDIELLEMDSF